MGITGLSVLMRNKNAPTCKIKRVRGVTLGVDSSILSAKFLYSHTTAIERYHMVPRMPYLTLIDTYYDPIIQYFKTLDIKLIFVLDWARNPLKKATNDTRDLPREEATKELRNIYANHEDVEQAYLDKLRKRAIKPDTEFYAEFIQYLIRKNQAYVIAPVEADSQLVSMQKQGIIDYILSEDSDILVLGGDNVVQNYSYNPHLILMVYFQYKNIS